METPNLEQYRYILSIDIGIHHLAFVLLEIDRRQYTIHDIVWMELVDITQFHHLDKDSARHCTLQHTRTVSDWLAHIFQLNHELFQLCDHILIERQPPGGQIAVEQLFFFAFRSKAVLVHPRSVHAFFGWTNEDYEGRKRKSTRVFAYRLSQNQRNWVREEFHDMNRQHDLSDAYCQAVFFCHTYGKMHRTASDAFPELEQYRFSQTC